jgi:formate dehydrogenase maturation protein FdhE
MNKLLLVLIVLFMSTTILGCASSNHEDEAMVKEIQKMQQRIDELEREVKRVETKQETQIVIKEPTVVSCSTCNGFGHIESDKCRGTGNSMLVCLMCDGTGVDGYFACLACKGTGFLECNLCWGEGRVICYNCGGTSKIQY